MSFNQILSSFNENGETALFFSLDNKECLVRLMSYNESVNHKDKNGRTLLHKCVENKSISQVDNLFYALKETSKIIDVNTYDDNGNTAAYYAIKNER